MAGEHVEIMCPDCNGTGMVYRRPEYASCRCYTCNGTGRVCSNEHGLNPSQEDLDVLAALKAAVEPLELYHAYGWPDRDGVISKVKAVIRIAEAAIAKAEGEGEETCQK